MAHTKAERARLIAYVDARGGAFAAMAATIARAEGREAIAATVSAKVDVPAEIALVLGEIGARAPEVITGAIPGDAERVDLSAWPLVLHEGEGDLERRALARIARDRIEKRLTTAL